MNKINLSQLMEEVINNVINHTHYLKQLVNKYKHLKVNNNPLIQDSDFNVLYNLSIENRGLITQIASGTKGYIDDIDYSTPVNRIYNFYQNLVNGVAPNQNGEPIRFKVPDSEKGTVNGAIKELIELASLGLSVHASNKTQGQSSATNKFYRDDDGFYDHDESGIIQLNPKSKQQEINKFPLSQTKFLKDINYINNNGELMYVTDEDFHVFKNKENSNIKNIYDAILNNNKNLPISINTPENKVYQLWSRLKTQCLSAMVDYVHLLNISNIDPIKNKNYSQTTYSKELTNTESVNLKSLTNGSDIGISYKLLTKTLNKQIQDSVNEIYDFYHLRGNYEFFNKNYKNHKFIFWNHVPNTLEIGKVYKLKYSLSKEYYEIISVQITGLQSKNLESFAQVKECNAADEIKNLIYNIRNNE